MTISSADLQNLRFGPVRKAAGLKESEEPKIHFWRTTNKLKIGRDVEGGNRRYGLDDASRLLLMRMLSEFQLPAQAAVDITNEAYDIIGMLTQSEYFRIDQQPDRRGLDPWAVDIRRRNGSLEAMVNLEDELDRDDPYSDLVIRPPRVRLNRLVEYARDNLIQEIGVDVEAFPRNLRVSSAAQA